MVVWNPHGLVVSPWVFLEGGKLTNLLPCVLALQHNHGNVSYALFKYS